MRTEKIGEALTAFRGGQWDFTIGKAGGSGGNYLTDQKNLKHQYPNWGKLTSKLILAIEAQQTQQ